MNPSAQVNPVAYLLATILLPKVPRDEPSDVVDTPRSELTHSRRRSIWPKQVR